MAVLGCIYLIINALSANREYGVLSMGADPTPNSDTWTHFWTHTHAAAAGGQTREPQGASPTVKPSLSESNLLLSKSSEKE